MNTSANSEYLVITANGEDRVGLVERFTNRILDAGANIEASRMAVLGGQFAILMLVSGPWNALSKLEDLMPSISEQLNLAIVCKRTRERATTTPMVPYHVEVVAMDHPGIVNKLSSFFARRGINIEELNTSAYPAAHTGTPMFSVQMTVGIPAGTHFSTLRGDFLDYCDDLNLDGTLEPSRI
ncbi:MAG: glycine cleavage system protein R [Pseudomonadota bacterium]